MFNGEDLARYRRVSSVVYSTTLVRATGSMVARLSMKENWVDVSRMGMTRMSKGYGRVGEKNVMGLEGEQKLLVVIKVATKLRELIRSEYSLTCCGWGQSTEQIT